MSILNLLPWATDPSSFSLTPDEVAAGKRIETVAKKTSGAFENARVAFQEAREALAALGSRGDHDRQLMVLISPIVEYLLTRSKTFTLATGVFAANLSFDTHGVYREAVNIFEWQIRELYLVKPNLDRCVSASCDDAQIPGAISSLFNSRETLMSIIFCLVEYKEELQKAQDQATTQTGRSIYMPGRVNPTIDTLVEQIQRAADVVMHAHSHLRKESRERKRAPEPQHDGETTDEDEILGVRPARKAPPKKKARKKLA